MKKFSQLIEESALTQLAQNTDNGQGITNKYTPINNIITNVRNYFGATYNIVVTEGLGNSIELRCSRWINPELTYEDLNGIIVGHKTINSYVHEQGLTRLKLLQEGQRVVAIFYAPEIKDDATKTFDKIPDAAEYMDYSANECEIVAQYSLTEGKEDDAELEDTTQKELKELIVSANKVKAAQEFSDLIGQQLDLPAEYYWKAVKDKDGNESIALRHKTEKRRPFGKKAEIVDSVINIYGLGDDAIWVDGYDDIDNMPEDMKTLIDSILQILGAEKTSDVCVYSLSDPEDDDDNDEDGDEDENEDIDNSLLGN